MGIDLICDEATFGCSYSGWHTIREFIIKSTFDYITDKFAKDKELYKDIANEDNEHYIGEGSQYFIYSNQINILITNLNLPNILSNFNINTFNTFNKFNGLFTKFINLTYDNLDNKDALIYFNIDGLYALCNKSDCEGFYSVGNSKNIIRLFDLIEPFVKKDNSVYMGIYEESFSRNKLYDVFKKSVENKKKVIIC